MKLLAGAFALFACAMTAGAAPTVTESAQCSLNLSAAEPCQLSDQVGPDGVHTMEFSRSAGQTHFVGKSQTGWWSGQLDGQPAMGYELNRGHVVFSTLDLKSRFEWWSQGHQHGNY